MQYPDLLLRMVDEKNSKIGKIETCAVVLFLAKSCNLIGHYAACADRGTDQNKIMGISIQCFVYNVLIADQKKI